MTAIAKKIHADARIAGLERVVRDLGLLHSIDGHRNYIADDGRLQSVSMLEAIIRPSLSGEVGELSERPVPPHDFQVG